MKSLTIPAVAVLLVASVQAGPSERDREDNRVALGQKLLGAWKGQTACAGRFHFRPDGTYELAGHGPASSDSAGTWKLRGDVLPATLVLTCQNSDDPDEVGTTIELRLIQLDDKSLGVRYPNKTVNRFARVKK
jgi:hypothetical protein